MKRLLLALLVSGVAISTVGQASASSDCVVWHSYYYDSPGGTYCGLRYVFCSGRIYTEGCQTNYYQEYRNYSCYCPEL